MTVGSATYSRHEQTPWRQWTSAMATAQFLAEQKPGGSCYVVGEAGPDTLVVTDEAPEVLTRFPKDLREI